MDALPSWARSNLSQPLAVVGESTVFTESSSSSSGDSSLGDQSKVADESLDVDDNDDEDEDADIDESSMSSDSIIISAGPKKTSQVPSLSLGENQPIVFANEVLCFSIYSYLFTLSNYTSLFFQCTQVE
jgi:hypothetical protein